MHIVFNVREVLPADADPSMVWDALVFAAVHNRVSDIHILAQRQATELAFRIDGDMRPQGEISNEFARRLISHVKSISGMDIAEHRRPTEGRLKVQAGDRTVDLRLSSIPSIHGQDLVVRIFDHTVSLMELTQLGLMREQLDTIYDLIARPHGLILVSGPTGSGKTTTLYAMLQHLSGHARKIVTIEDPVEYDLPGVNQTQVNYRIGVDFAHMLTALLRQDPDIIMVGEIRDEETAVTAVRAANTGNLVLATTHATRASRAVETMLSLGVHPYFLAVALRGVLAQVLVKQICPHCKTPLPETTEMVLEDAVRRRLPDNAETQLYEGRGCDHCLGTGYRGRLGLFELFAPDENIKQLIVDRQPAMEIDKAIRKAELLTLEEVGKLALVTGQTTLHQLADVLPTL
ncbi:MAG TPA: ATPase [Phycisphaerales bacterium]|nr:ATPase [Phycisphaerales bacterium]